MAKAPKKDDGKAWEPTGRTSAGRLEIAEIVAMALQKGWATINRSTGSLRPPTGKMGLQKKVGM